LGNVKTSLNRQPLKFWMATSESRSKVQISTLLRHSVSNQRVYSLTQRERGIYAEQKTSTTGLHGVFAKKESFETDTENGPLA